MHTHRFLRETGEYLGTFETLYPDIRQWFERIIREERSERRTIIAAWSGNQLSGLAVTKEARVESKLCHISVLPDFRESGLGHALLKSALTILTNQRCEGIRVTTGPEVRESFGGFFVQAGFSVRNDISDRYRSGIPEFTWHAKLNTLRKNLSASSEQKRFHFFPNEEDPNLNFIRHDSPNPNGTPQFLYYSPIRGNS